MNVLLIGSGGREHAIAYKIRESSSLKKLYILPGNPGTLHLGENINLKVEDHNSIINFCKGNKIELIIIGPEKPLVDGLADSLKKNNFFVFGPDAKAAEIEAHKSFAKSLMKKYNIPTSDYVEFNSSDYDDAKIYLSSSFYPLVIKADGLAAGKGVIICNNKSEAVEALEDIFIKKIFGDAGEKIVIENFLKGEEASIFAITDGNDYICLPSSQDHKRIGEKDTGKNTGGMGAYSPAPIVTDDILKEVEEKIIKPALDGLRKEGRKFIGCLYCGLMISDEGTKVVEFNCRFGDPETQAVLPLLTGDFLQLLYSAAKGNIDKDAVQYSGGSAVCIVAASKGYPDSYESGFEINGLNNPSNNKNDILVFHAGTKQDGNKIITNGGRVLCVTSVINNFDLKAAKEKAYNALEKISFKNIYFRKDIAEKSINK